MKDILFLGKDKGMKVILFLGKYNKELYEKLEKYNFINKDIKPYLDYTLRQLIQDEN